jgi:ribose-phosphate pyrophosphokinase
MTSDTDSDVTLFALHATRDFGTRVAAGLGVALGAHEEREFEDGEHKARPLVSVRNRAVYVIQSLYSDPQQSVNDKLVRLLFFLGALRDAGAARVTALLPYLAYARKDAKTQPRDPVTTRYLAQLIEAVGTDHVVALDVHNIAAFQNAFRIRTDHVSATRLFAEHLAERIEARAAGHGRPDCGFAGRLGAEPVVVVSPDAGGVKRAERLRAALARRLGRDVNAAFLDKARGGGIMRGGRIVGEVSGAAAVIIDDLISTGGTLRHAAAACQAAGARRVIAAATHGLFVGAAAELLRDPALETILVTDSVAPWRLDPALITQRLTVLPVAPLFAETIRRLHCGGSLTELLEG